MHSAKYNKALLAAHLSQAASDTYAFLNIYYETLKRKYQAKNNTTRQINMFDRIDGRPYHECLDILNTLSDEQLEAEILSPYLAHFLVIDEDVVIQISYSIASQKTRSPFNNVKQ